MGLKMFTIVKIVMKVYTSKLFLLSCYITLISYYKTHSISKNISLTFINFTNLRIQFKFPINHQCDAETSVKCNFIKVSKFCLSKQIILSYKIS